MQARLLIIGLCIALLAACAVIAYQARQLAEAKTQLAPSTNTVYHTRETTRHVTNHLSVPAPERSTRSSPPTTARQFHWRQVESADYQSYIANLRGIGCPEQTIRDIVISDVTKLYAERRKALTTGTNVPPYWQEHTPLASLNPDQKRQLKEIDQQRTALIRDLLGVDLATEQRKNLDGYAYTDNRIGFLSAEKQDQVSALRQAFNEQWTQVRLESSQQGKSADETAVALRQLNEQRLANLARILSPDELRLHELQTSWTALDLRARLADFKPDATEFEAIYDSRRDFDDMFVHYNHGRNDPEFLALKTAMHNMVERQIRRTLGETRYADYLRSQAAKP